MRHYDQGSAEMKQIINSSGISGSLILKAYHCNIPQPMGFKTENSIANVGIHELDICLWLLGNECEDV